MKEARISSRNAKFSSIVLYAWNEFSEGGWVAPTVGEGTQRIRLIGDTLGRAELPGRVQLVFPARVDPILCDIRSNPRTLAEAGAGCASQADALTTDWPCPWPMSVVGDLLRAPSGSEAPIYRGAWQVRTCESLGQRK